MSSDADVNSPRESTLHAAFPVSRLIRDSAIIRSFNSPGRLADTVRERKVRALGPFVPRMTVLASLSAGFFRNPGWVEHRSGTANDYRSVGVIAVVTDRRGKWRQITAIMVIA